MIEIGYRKHQREPSCAWSAIRLTAATRASTSSGFDHQFKPWTALRPRRSGGLIGARPAAAPVAPRERAEYGSGPEVQRRLSAVTPPRVK
jgi:hypothetical protein